MTFVERERAAEFFSSWQGRHSRGPSSNVTLWLHDRLLEAAYDVASPQPARRRLAITTAGVPIVYSHKSTRRTQASPFRMLVEPGGTGITVAEQVRLSRALLHHIFDHLGWRHARASVDEVLGRLLPVDPDAFDGWHGGLGFGMEADAGGPELRLYCNVRHGELTGRWQRLADAVGEFADERTEGAFRELVQAAAPLAVPAGVGLAVSAGEVRGIRLYVGLLEATADAAMAAAPATFAGSAPAVRRLVDSYRSRFGELGAQDITLAYDFAVRDRMLWPAVARLKVDLWCEPANDTGRWRLLEWAEDCIAWLGLAPSSLRAFFSELDRAFPGATFQYASLGCRDAAEEFGVYCIPGRSTAADGAAREAAADGNRTTGR